MAKKYENKRLAIVDQDPWLEPVQDAVYDRYERFIDRKQGITDQYSNLQQFASAYHYFGIHFNISEKAWIYREWAPAAKDYF